MSRIQLLIGLALIAATVVAGCQTPRRQTSEELRLELATAQARVETARADLRVSQHRLKRMEAGLADQMFSQEEVEEARLNVDFRNESLELAKVEAALAQFRLNEFDR